MPDHRDYLPQKQVASELTMRPSDNRQGLPLGAVEGSHLTEQGTTKTTTKRRPRRPSSAASAVPPCTPPTCRLPTRPQRPPRPAEMTASTENPSIGSTSDKARVSKARPAPFEVTAITPLQRRAFQDRSNWI
jgi:hypothetical protein